MEDGSLKAIGQEAEKAADSTDKLGRSARSADRNLKGTADMTSNATKGFSKMSQGITGGLVPAYATLAANVFALSAAFNFFKRAADVKILEEGQKSYAAATGIALQSITANLREASGGMLGFREAAEAAAIGVAKGFSPEQLNELAEGARKASTALGRNFEDAFDRLIRGASKAEPELLDELGITLRLETATKRYADTVGKSADDLNTFERSQAVLIETQRQLEAQFGQMEGKTNPFVELAKTFEDIVKAGTNFLLPFFEGVANIINRNIFAAIAVFGALAVSIIKMILPTETMTKAMENFEKGSKESLEKAEADLESYKQKIQEVEAAINSANAKSVQDAASGSSFQGTDSKLIQKAQKGELTDPKEVGRLKSILKKAEAEYKRTGKIKSGIFKNSNAKDRAALRASLSAMNKDHKTFLQKRKMQLNKQLLVVKKHYAKVKAIGTRAFVGIGRAATRMGKAVGKAMKFAGFIGMAMMLFEVIKSVAMKIGNVMKVVTKGLDLVINGIVDGLNFVLGGIGKGIDFVMNSIKTVMNMYIKAYNLLPFDDLEEFDNKSKAVGDSLGNLIPKANLSSPDSFLNRMASGAQDFMVNSEKASETFDKLKDKIKTVKEDLGNAVKGNKDFLEGTMKSLDTALQRGKITAEEYAAAVKAAQSKIEQNKATNISTLGVSSIMEEMQESGLSDSRRQKLQDMLDDMMPNLEKQHKGFAEAIKKGQVDVVKGLEKTAQEATAGMASLKNSILDLGSAMGSGDLIAAEIALDALKDTSKLTSENFQKLFGEDSEAAREALEKYEKAFTKAGHTTEGFRKELKDLRKAQLALEKSKILESVYGGKAADFIKANNAVADLTNQIKKLTLEKATADEKRKKVIEKEIELLRLQLTIANAQKDATFTKGAGGFTEAVGTAAANAKSRTELGEDSTTLERAQAASEIMKDLSKGFADMGPEGKAVQAMMEGLALAIDSAAALRDTLKEITTEMGIEMPTSFKEFSEMFAEMDMQSKAQFLSAAFGAIANQIGALASAAKAKTDQVVAGLDKEIAAEKKRDGITAASQAKIAKLEAKKENAKRKGFERDKKLKIAQTVMATAAGIMEAFKMGPILGPIFGALVAATGAMQLSIIKGMTYNGGGSSPSSPSKISVGKRENKVDLAQSNSALGELAYVRGASGVGTSASNFKPAFSGYKHRAGGGYVVGEQGPEVFMPDVPGEIIPSGQATGNPVNVNFTIQAIDTQNMEEALTVQRNNIIGMIREAAHSNGDLFLEGVDLNESV
jgi:hypothetical protein